ncbi:MULTISPECIES: hypothetical protein [unclassified Aureispira]|uniref:hypothetical protein n=1 Tax=unclassified Aureispira TaxID=2649989 RepID=UPI0006960C82|nr:MULTISPECIES: hypothetical protein [unclassified Aureispira]WMX15882.1 hypothetical protein QP953_05715 [Aureispira sp. CCB-E]
MKTIVNSTQYWQPFSILLIACLLVASCGGPSGKDYAQKLCDCSDAFSKATIQLKAGTINQATFEQLKTEHLACMGEDDPLEKLKDDPEALVQFKAEFINALENQCPEIARNMGY